MLLRLKISQSLSLLAKWSLTKLLLINMSCASPGRDLWSPPLVAARMLSLGQDIAVALSWVGNLSLFEEVQLLPHSFVVLFAPSPSFLFSCLNCYPTPPPSSDLTPSIGDYIS